MSRPFAVFDIDGTLIRWQLFHAIVSELANNGKLSEDAEAVINAARMTWKQREDRDSFKQYEKVLVNVYFAALKGLKVSDYTAAADIVFEEHKNQVYTYTRDLVRELKAKDYILFALSGSHQEIIRRLAQYYGFDEALGSDYLHEDGYFTGEEIEVVSDKRAALDKLVRKHGLSYEGSIAIGDSEGDIGLLEAVETAIAFNPSERLFEVAREHGWQIVIERKNVVYTLEQHDGQYILA